MKTFIMLLLILASGPPLDAAPADRAPITGLRVALTFDDLPFVPRANCSVAEVLAVNGRLLEVLKREEIPATGLVVGDRPCGDDDKTMGKVLRMWLDHGHDLGNHTHSHRDLNAVTLDWYVRDIGRTQEILDDLDSGARTIRWFRAPFLHMGDTREKREGLRAFLAKNRYSVAPVTVDNQEWVFAIAYEHALESDDKALADRVVSAYLAHLEASFAYYEALSETLFERQVPQVLLLHANRLNADHLGAVTEMLRERGYDFISMRDAVRDPAYAHKDSYVGPRGLSWLQRWALTAGVKPAPEPREPGWVAALTGM